MKGNYSEKKGNKNSKQKQFFIKCTQKSNKYDAEYFTTEYGTVIT